MKKKFIGLCAILLLTAGCGKVPKLQNGKEAIVSFDKDDMISVDDYYTMLKDNYGLQALISMVDTHILEKEFEDFKEEAKNNADAYIDSWIENAGGEDEFLARLQSETKYETLDAYRSYIYLSYLQSHAIEEYAKKQISDDEVQKYYDNKSVGDVEISHILITSDAKSDASADDKKKAEEAAKKKAQEVIDKLNDAKKNKKDIAQTFKDLVKEYSKDDATKDKEGALGKINYGTLGDKYDELIDAALKLKDGEYSTKVITTELGYHVILKTKSYEKEALDKLKDKIVETLAKEYVTKNQNSIGLTALQHYRKEYGMEIQDEEIKKQYSRYIEYALATINNANTTK